MATGARKNVSDWKERVGKCLCGRRFSDSQEAPPKLNLPENPSHEDLERFLDHITQVCEQLNSESPSNGIGRLASEWAEYKNSANSFVDGLPKDLSALVGTDLLLPLLSGAIGGLSRLHWVTAGLSLLAWSLDAIAATSSNSQDCLQLLSRTGQLMKETKELWSDAIVVDHVDYHLQNSIMLTSRCTITCGSLMQKPYVWRFLNGNKIKDLLASLSKDLERVQSELTDFVARLILDGRTVTIGRQLTLRPSTLVGREQLEDEAMNILESDKDEVIAVCLHGMGGIGKSVIAKNLLAKFQGKKTSQGRGLYKCCSVDLPFGVKREGLSKYQKEILDKLTCRAQPEFSTCEEGRILLEKGLKKIKQSIFLFLDNVLDGSYLGELLPEAECFPTGSKLLVTTRHEEVHTSLERDLKIKHCKLFKVEVLGNQAAKEILWKHIDQDERGSLNKEMEELEEEVLKLCSGLPLALRVVGRYIASRRDPGPKSAKVWEQVIKSMKRATPLSGSKEDELYARVKFSISDLDSGTQQAFLDIIASTYDQPMDRSIVECLVDNSRYLEILQERALVELEEVDELLINVRVHDVLKALGLKLAEHDVKEVRIITQEALDDIQDDQEALQRVVGLVNVNVEAQLFHHMPRLRFLLDVEIEGDWQKAKLKHLLVVDVKCATFDLPFDVTASKDLKALTWVRWHADSDFVRKSRYVTTHLEVTSKKHLYPFEIICIQFVTTPLCNDFRVAIFKKS